MATVLCMDSWALVVDALALEGLILQELPGQFFPKFNKRHSSAKGEVEGVAIYECRPSSRKTASRTI